MSVTKRPLHARFDRFYNEIFLASFSLPESNGIIPRIPYFHAEKETFEYANSTFYRF